MTSASGPTNSTARQPAADLAVLPGQVPQELLQPLMVDPEALRHRLQALALPVEHQPTQVQLAFS